MSLELDQQAIIVTGGASGIGRETCLALARKGSDVIVADFNLAGAEQVAAEVQALGRRAHAFKVDVTQPAEVEALVEFAVDKLGTLTGIFNNAGIGDVVPLLELEPAKYHKVVNVDQHGVYYGIYYAAKKLVALAVKGTIVNTASIYGSIASKGNFHYNAAKAAVISMSRSGALELAEHGIRVVGVAPGYIETPMMGDDATLKAGWAAQHMRGELIQPGQVASVVAFLFTEGANAINGSTVAVEDGFLGFKV